jgi:orotidine-5'-phosphate decarboxylase
VLVGLDPRLERLPEGLRVDDASDLSAVAKAYRLFCYGVIDVVADKVPIVKPQAAFFEQLGSRGLVVLHQVMQYAQSKGLLVILDAKRNDIGSTATAYAQGYLGRSPASVWGADSMTVSPYLGGDSLLPFVDVAKRRGAGLFVLVKTSNPGGQLFQDLQVDGRPVYLYVGQLVEQYATDTCGQGGYGSVGAVVGATYPEQLTELRSCMPHTWLLVPGFGAQGGGAKDVAGGFDPRGLGAVINNSRGIIFAHARPEYTDKYGDARWQDAVEAATLDMIAQLRDQTPAGKL